VLARLCSTSSEGPLPDRLAEPRLKIRSLPSGDC
jgi:hypothetical protein